MALVDQPRADCETSEALPTAMSAPEDRLAHPAPCMSPTARLRVDQWESREAREADRRDVLSLESVGSLLVAELQPDEAAETADLQALKYAACCSQLRVSGVVDMYARFHGVSQDAAAAQLYEHSPAIEEERLGRVRIGLVAGGFGPNVSTVVLWLSEMGVRNRARLITMLCDRSLPIFAATRFIEASER